MYLTINVNEFSLVNALRIKLFCQGHHLNKVLQYVAANKTQVYMPFVYREDLQMFFLPFLVVAIGLGPLNILFPTVRSLHMRFEFLLGYFRG